MAASPRFGPLPLRLRLLSGPRRLPCHARHVVYTLSFPPLDAPFRVARTSLASPGRSTLAFLTRTFLGSLPSVSFYFKDTPFVSLRLFIFIFD